MAVYKILWFAVSTSSSFTDFNSDSPSDVTVCDSFRQQVQPQFTCIHDSTPVAPAWIVTGSATATILQNTNTGQFLYPTAAVTNEEATLTVDLSAPGGDLNGSCYSCSINIAGQPPATSRQGCLTVTCELSLKLQHVVCT